MKCENNACRTKDEAKHEVFALVQMSNRQQIPIKMKICDTCNDTFAFINKPVSMGLKVKEKRAYTH